MSRSLLFTIFLIFNTACFLQAKNHIFLYGDSASELVKLLSNNGIEITQLENLNSKTINELPSESSIIIAADDYPSRRVSISGDVYEAIRNKPSIRLYIEYPESFPNENYNPHEIFVGELERGVVTSDFFGEELPNMSLLGINKCHLLPIKHHNPLIVLAKVAGFDKAEYGISDTKTYPVLVKDNNMLIATTSLSNFSKGRYSPNESWRVIWEKITRWLVKNDDIDIENWSRDPRPAYSETEMLDAFAKSNSIKQGADWYYKSKLFLHPSWKDEWLEYQGDGKLPFGPPIENDKLIGDGSMGILEGHASSINTDGTQVYRYWIRNDVQGEVAFALAAAGDLLDEKEYRATSEKLLDFLFYTSGSRSITNDRHKGSYGLLGWAYTHPFVIYADDNARAVLGAIGASSYLDNTRWNKLIVETIIANYRTTSKYGFQGKWLNSETIDANGWEHYYNSDVTRAQPHFESWMQACFIWLYDKTGYEPFLEKAKTGIRIIMESYPETWRWTNGLQQERARMILPLAWLVRVENTEEHMSWLTTVVDDLLKFQQPNGALIEIMGDDQSLASYGRTTSNASYGTTEAPLIFENGDPVADMLYTSNFALFTLNEAAQSTGNMRYTKAVDDLSGFLTRIQVNSETHPDLDGAWFRGFDFGRWDYWASNADSGWGAWCTLSGWVQSWIVATKVLIEEKNSFWDQTNDISIIDEFNDSLWMLE